MNQESGSTPAFGVQSLALRLAAWLLLTGGVLAAVLAMAIARLPIVIVAGTTRHALPGSNGSATIGTAPVAIFACAAALLIALGMTAHLLERFQARPVGPGHARPMPYNAWRKRRPMILLVVGFAFLFVVLGVRWHRANLVGGSDPEVSHATVP